MSTKVFIDGEHGTTGLQIRTRLAGRGDLEILSIPEADRRNRDIRADHLRSADIVILCLPDEAARELVSLLEGSGATRIIDTSTAHRTADGWAYGFAEMTAGQDARIAAARLVANPGCYPTGAIALVRPLVEAGLMARDHNVTVNAVSGYTGGGKQLIAQMEDRSHPDAIAAPHFLYGLSLQHKHVPEMRVHGLLTHPPVFSPSVGRFPQGMIVQVPLHTGSLARSVDPADLHAALAAHYQGTAVEVVPLEESAGLARIDAEELAGSDRLRLFVFGAKGKGQANLVALLDNLGKGASGAAVQNMDSMIAGGR